MKDNEELAEYRYLNDSFYHNLVDLLINAMQKTNISHDDLHDAVNLATKKVNKELRYNFDSAKCIKLENEISMDIEETYNLRK